MQTAAYGPEEVFAASEQGQFPRRENAGSDEILGIVNPVNVFGYPEQRVQVAKPALAFLDIGLDEVPRLACAFDPRLAFRQFGRHELAGGLSDQFTVKSGP